VELYLGRKSAKFWSLRLTIALAASNILQQRLKTNNHSVDGDGSLSMRPGIICLTSSATNIAEDCRDQRPIGTSSFTSTPTLQRRNTRLLPFFLSRMCAIKPKRTAGVPSVSRNDYQKERSTNWRTKIQKCIRITGYSPW